MNKDKSYQRASNRVDTDEDSLDHLLQQMQQLIEHDGTPQKKAFNDKIIPPKLRPSIVQRAFKKKIVSSTPMCDKIINNRFSSDSSFTFSPIKNEGEEKRRESHTLLKLPGKKSENKAVVPDSSSIYLENNKLGSNDKQYNNKNERANTNTSPDIECSKTSNINLNDSKENTHIANVMINNRSVSDGNKSNIHNLRSIKNASVEVENNNETNRDVKIISSHFSTCNTSSSNIKSLKNIDHDLGKTQNIQNGISKKTVCNNKSFPYDETQENIDNTNVRITRSGHIYDTRQKNFRSKNERPKMSINKASLNIDDNKKKLNYSKATSVAQNNNDTGINSDHSQVNISQNGTLKGNKSINMQSTRQTRRKHCIPQLDVAIEKPSKIPILDTKSKSEELFKNKNKLKDKDIQRNNFQLNVQLEAEAVSPLQELEFNRHDRDSNEEIIENIKRPTPRPRSKLIEKLIETGANISNAKVIENVSKSLEVKKDKVNTSSTIISGQDMNKLVEKPISKNNKSPNNEATAFRCYNKKFVSAGTSMSFNNNLSSKDKNVSSNISGIDMNELVEKPISKNNKSPNNEANAFHCYNKKFVSTGTSMSFNSNLPSKDKNVSSNIKNIVEATRNERSVSNFNANDDISMNSIISGAKQRRLSEFINRIATKNITLKNGLRFIKTPIRKTNNSSCRSLQLKRSLRSNAKIRERQTETSYNLPSSSGSSSNISKILDEVEVNLFESLNSGSIVERFSKSSDNYNVLEYTKQPWRLDDDIRLPERNSIKINFIKPLQSVSSSSPGITKKRLRQYGNKLRHKNKLRIDCKSSSTSEFYDHSDSSDSDVKSRENTLVSVTKSDSSAASSFSRTKVDARPTPTVDHGSIRVESKEQNVNKDSEESRLEDDVEKRCETIINEVTTNKTNTHSSNWVTTANKEIDEQVKYINKSRSSVAKRTPVVNNVNNKVRIVNKGNEEIESDEIEDSYDSEIEERVKYINKSRSSVPKHTPIVNNVNNKATIVNKGNEEIESDEIEDRYESEIHGFVNNQTNTEINNVLTNANKGVNELIKSINKSQSSITDSSSQTEADSDHNSFVSNINRSAHLSDEEIIVNDNGEIEKTNENKTQKFIINKRNTQINEWLTDVSQEIQEPVEPLLWSEVVIVPITNNNDQHISDSIRQMEHGSNAHTKSISKGLNDADRNVTPQLNAVLDSIEVGGLNKNDHSTIKNQHPPVTDIELDEKSDLNKRYLAVRLERFDIMGNKKEEDVKLKGKSQEKSQIFKDPPKKVLLSKKSKNRKSSLIQPSNETTDVERGIRKSSRDRRPPKKMYSSNVKFVKGSSNNIKKKINLEFDTPLTKSSKSAGTKRTSQHQETSKNISHIRKRQGVKGKKANTKIPLEEQLPAENKTTSKRKGKSTTKTEITAKKKKRSRSLTKLYEDSQIQGNDNQVNDDFNNIDQNPIDFININEQHVYEGSQIRGNDNQVNDDFNNINQNQNDFININEQHGNLFSNSKMLNNIACSQDEVTTNDNFLRPGTSKNISSDSGRSTLLKSSFDDNILRRSKTNARIRNIRREVGKQSLSTLLNKNNKRSSRMNVAVFDDQLDVPSELGSSKLKFVDNDPVFTTKYDNLKYSNTLDDTNGVSMYYLEIPPGERKDKHTGKNHNQCFFINEGIGHVRIGDKVSLLKKSSRFVVPMGFPYSIKNDSRTIPLLMSCVKIPM